MNIYENLIGRDIVLPLGFLGNVVKSPSGGGSDLPMERFPCLVTVMTLYWFWRCQQTRSLWSYSDMNFLSFLHFFYQWCFTGGCIVIYSYISGYTSVA